MIIKDISSELFSSPVYPGDPDPRLHLINRIECDDDFNVSAIYASLHTGTHIDAPSHVIDDENAKTIDDIPLEKCIGPVQIITLPNAPITGETIEKYFPKDAKRIILRTGPETTFFKGAAEDLATLNLDLLGYDKFYIGGNDEVGFHRAILNTETVLLEGLNLSDVPNDGEYFLIAQPIKIAQREASFVRALLIEDYVFWSSKA